LIVFIYSLVNCRNIIATNGPAIKGVSVAERVKAGQCRQIGVESRHQPEGAKHGAVFAVKLHFFWVLRVSRYKVYWEQVTCPLTQIWLRAAAPSRWCPLILCFL